MHGRHRLVNAIAHETSDHTFNPLSGVFWVNEEWTCDVTGTDPSDRMLSFPIPLYIVAAPLGPEGVTRQPLLLPGAPAPGTFDDDLLPAISGLWYAMHLPKSRFETLDLPLSAIQDGANGYPRSHSIALVPDSLLDDPLTMGAISARFQPSLVISSAERSDAATRLSAELGILLAPATFHQLGQALLETHWRQLSSAWMRDWPADFVVDSSAPIWTWPITQDASRLPLVRLSRLLGSPAVGRAEFATPLDSVGELRYLRAHLDALVDFERQGLGFDEARSRLVRATRHQLSTTNARLSLGISGTAPRYVRFSTGPSDGVERSFNDDYPDIRSLMVSHSAIGDDSMGIVLEDVVPPVAFTILADLERHWTERPRADVVRRLLHRLDESMSPMWTKELVWAVKSASSIEAFTNFPVGLLTLPGDTSPLAARVPISYRPMNPLTRALQFELTPSIPIDLSSGFKVLVAECISANDPVGQVSRSGWRLLADEMRDRGAPVDVSIVEALTREDVRTAVAEARPDVLVLSAHGFSAPDLNLAGLWIGEEQSMGDDLGNMPPLVILSACHTSPRGGGVVSVGDLLIGAGATAVLSTLVPVDVRHNSHLVSRLLQYMSLAVGENASQPERSVLDVWHRVQASNVVIDLAYGSSSLEQWAFSIPQNASPIARFMADENGTPLRPAHLYADAEARLLTIAASQGDEDRVRGWLRAPGYLPESMMYTVLGRPWSLLLKKALASESSSIPPARLAGANPNANPDGRATYGSKVGSASPTPGRPPPSSP